MWQALSIRTDCPFVIQSTFLVLLGRLNHCLHYSVRVSNRPGFIATSVTRYTFSEHRTCFCSVGSNVLVNVEKVLRIVFSLNFHQPIVIVSVGRFDPIDSFVHHKVHAGAAQTVRMHCRPIVFGPSANSRYHSNNSRASSISQSMGPANT
jgi:hypothetical protein